MRLPTILLIVITYFALLGVAFKSIPLVFIAEIMAILLIVWSIVRINRT